jgi:hypothetical protein
MLGWQKVNSREIKRKDVILMRERWLETLRLSQGPELLL